MKKSSIAILAVIIILIGILVFNPFGNKANGNVVSAGEITMYKSSSCGCCEVYSNYFKSKGNNNMEIINTNDLSQIKKDLGIPTDLQSCHVTVMGDYFIEGHIPLEAIEKLLSEKPDIAGIAMPGMPSGSPGMPGTKFDDFVIFAVEHNGSYYEFMRI